MTRKGSKIIIFFLRVERFVIYPCLRLTLQVIFLGYFTQSKRHFQINSDKFRCSGWENEQREYDLIFNLLPKFQEFFVKWLTFRKSRIRGFFRNCPGISHNQSSFGKF